MSITTRSPRKEIETLQDRFNRMLAEFDTWPWTSASVTMMPIDLQENDDEIIVKASLPGFQAEDIDVEFRNSMLHLSGETKEEKEEKEGTWHRRERRVGRVERSISLPAAVDPEKVEATMADGVLTVTMPKKESSPGQKITVKAS